MKPTLASIITADNLWEITGELSFKTVRALLKKSKKLFSTNYKHIKIDLAKINYSDSSGLTLLIAWLRLAKQRKKSVEFKNLPQQLINIITLAKLNDILL